MAQLFTPSAERMLKVNFSTSENRVFAYDLSGNLIAEGSFHDYGTEPPSSDEPVIQHVWLGNHLIASITGSGDACFIATAAYGSPLAGQLHVFRAFRDRVINRFSFGRSFVDSYYHGWGPRGAAWLNDHDNAKPYVRAALAATSVPLRVMIFGNVLALVLIFSSSCLILLILVKKKGLGWRLSLAVSGGLAFSLVIVYSYLIEVPMASASYTEQGIYYYTSDHIGRPFNLRDDDKSLTWYEQHMAFGDPIHEWSSSMSAGSGDYEISWKPNFRFPGQYQDPDMGLSYTDSSLFVQNHYREYMPGLGRYNRVDPKANRLYNYSANNSIIFIDPFGLAVYRGFCFNINGGIISGLGYMDCDVMGICRNDYTQQKGKLKVIFAGLTVLSPLSINWYNIEQYDHLPGAGNITNMSGAASIVSFSFDFILGRYWYILQLGNTFSKSRESGTVQTGPQVGADLSGDWFLGTSSVTNCKDECCTTPGSFH